MGSDTKYVVGQIRHQFGSNLAVVIVANHTTHSDVQRAFVEGTIESAGFFYLAVDAETGWLKAVPYGESVSLNVKSKPERDRQLIERALRLNEVDVPGMKSRFA